MLRKVLLLTILLCLLAACTTQPVTNIEASQDAGGYWHYYVTIGDTNRTPVTKGVYDEIHGYWVNLRLGQYLECDLGKSIESKLADSVECTVESWEEN